MDDVGLSPEHLAEITAHFREEARRDWWSAIRMLWTSRHGDLASDISWFLRLKFRILCTVAMILQRGPADKIYGITGGLDMGFWQYKKLYAGWECKTLTFDPESVRYEIGTEGDWWM